MKDKPLLVASDDTKKDGLNKSLEKYKPSKHRKAYKIERKSKKRCYVR